MGARGLRERHHGEVSKVRRVYAGWVLAAATLLLVTGLWDGTGMLLAEFDEVRALAARLPYISGNW